MASQSPPLPVGPPDPAYPPDPGPPQGRPGQSYVHYVPVVRGQVGVVATRRGRGSGRGMAAAGLVLGYLVAVTVLAVAVAPEAVASGVEGLGDVGAAVVVFFENLVGFVGGPFA